MTTNCFYYYSFRMKKTINHNHNKIRKWFFHDHLFIKSSDETIEKFISPTNKYKNISYHAYLNRLTKFRECVCA